MRAIDLSMHWPKHGSLGRGLQERLAGSCGLYCVVIMLKPWLLKLHPATR